MARARLPTIALIWTQFAACHADRCAAVAQRLAGRAEVLGIEVATTSREYAAFASAGDVGGARKLTLFPDRAFESVPGWRRFAAVLRAAIGCRTVCIGVPYSQLDFVLLAFVLRLLGKRVILLSDSKFDDRPRHYRFEAVKALALSAFDGVITGGTRAAGYFRFLGFRRRPILPGCDGLSLRRVCADAALARGPLPSFSERDFVFVGRFIDVKDLPLLIDAFSAYVQVAGAKARRLKLIGTGPLEPQLRAQVAALGLAERVVFAGFLSGTELYGALARSLALLLVSRSETWGMVVNEAAALGLPAIVTNAPGARDVLVRNLVSGIVIENGTSDGVAAALLAMAGNEQDWEAMRQATLERAWLGDVESFADAIEVLHYPGAQPATQRIAAYRAACVGFPE